MRNFVLALALLALLPVAGWGADSADPAAADPLFARAVQVRDEIRAEIDSSMLSLEDKSRVWSHIHDLIESHQLALRGHADETGSSLPFFFMSGVVIRLRASVIGS